MKRVEFVSDGMSYIVLRGCWCIVTDLNVHATSKDDSKYCFYEEIEEVFDLFPNYRMKILLREFNVKLGRENIFKPTIENESLPQGSSDTGVRIANSATS
jgi:hypothetical protein